jgi:hypothetical protein
MTMTEPPGLSFTGLPNSAMLKTKMERLQVIQDLGQREMGSIDG